MDDKEFFPFADEPNTAAIVCRHVLCREKPILRIAHDEDGYWQFLCGGEHTADDGRIISLKEAFDLDKSVGNAAFIQYGESVERIDTESEWAICE